MDTGPGSLELDQETVGSRYLLLHTKGDPSSGELWKIKSKGPKVWSRETMIEKGYPNPNPQDYYLIIEIEPITDPEFKGIQWDFKRLKNYKSGNASAFPFTTSLSELMKHKIK